jgi:adenosylmethionine-8-amino-7-oxononanoate aminotransferase
MAYQFPDSYVFYRRLSHRFPCVDSAAGNYLIDEAGKRYLDASGGAAVVNLGHGVQQAGSEQTAAGTGHSI